MKKSPTSLFGFATAMLVASSAVAGFVTPRVSPLESAPAADAASRPVFDPAGLPAALWVTNTADSGPGSLRQAIADAAPGDTVRFDLHCPARIVLADTLVIDKDLIVAGPGPRELIVMRSEDTNTPSFRVFRIAAGSVVLSGMTIRNGRALNPGPNSDNLGGGILNRGALTVRDCHVIGNVAPTEADGFGFGGGIFTSGPLVVVDSTIAGNEASYAGGGICTFHASSFSAEGSTISRNHAGIQSGGLNFQGVVGSLKNCTISGNSIEPEGIASALLNISFGNEASTLSFSACTIAGNVGTTNGAVTFAKLPGNDLGVTNRLIGTLVADNEGPNFFFDGDVVFEPLGHNLDSDGSSGLLNGVNGDIVGSAGSPVDARLGKLLDNGGNTLTHALLPGSPALDAADCAEAEGAALTIDQRGFPRPQGNACDIGAFENQPPTIECPESRTIECTMKCESHRRLKVTVADPDGDRLMVVWFVDGESVQTNRVDRSHPPQPEYVELDRALGHGTHTIRVWVSDGKAAPVACESIITIRDRTPPKIIAVRASPSVLWPPNHKLVPVRILVWATDACGPVKNRIVSVSSNEPAGNKLPDWIITGDLTLLLRAERSPRGSGRVYTIKVESGDQAGNKSYATVKVFVP
jgi:hypothetical protein